MFKYLKENSFVLMGIGFGIAAIGAVFLVTNKQAGIVVFWPQYLTGTGIGVYVFGRILNALNRKDKK
jgi:hypothetical protein